MSCSNPCFCKFTVGRPRVGWAVQREEIQSVNRKRSCLNLILNASDGPDPTMQELNFPTDSREDQNVSSRGSEHG